MRIALLLSSLAFAACTVGEVGTANNTGTDAGTGTGSDSGSGKDPNACVDRLTPANGPHLHLAGNTSNKGMNCIVAGCHLNNSLGAGAPGFQFAGTVYTAGSPTTPSAGAMVRIVSGATTVPPVYTDTDGNFYFPAGSLAGTFSATTNVTACPTVTPMVTALVSGGGGGANSCNLCHVAGGSAGSVITL